MRMKTREDAKNLVELLLSREIGSSNIYYERSMGMEPALDGVKGERAVADSMAGKVVCIPITPFLTYEDIKFISGVINEFKRPSRDNETRPQL